MVYEVCTRVTRRYASRSTVSADIIQNAALRCWRAFPNLRPHANPIHLFTTITRREIQRLHDKRHRINITEVSYDAQ